MHAGLDFIDLDRETEPVDPAAVALVSAWVAREYGVLPVALSGGELVVAIATPADVDGVGALAILTGRRVRAVLATPEAIRRGQDRIYGPAVEQITATVAERLPPAEERRRAAELATRAGCVFVTLDPGGGPDPVNHTAAQIFSEELCRRLAILPISAREGSLTIATADPPEQLSLALRVAEVLSGRRPTVVIAARSELERAIDRVFGYLSRATNG